MGTINKIYLGCYLLLVSTTATANSIIDLRSQTPVNQEQLATHLISPSKVKYYDINKQYLNIG
ncbi:MAG: hypothetical protein EBY70_07075, partial [Burkholderiaceae bacterium]|nr:hypothetical protein [Burkholderiaceae bacterium]